MIRIYAARREGCYRLYAEGHASPLPDREAVCAGVSALVEALARFAAENTECRHLRWSAEPGRFFLACRGGLGRAFDVVLTGLAGIAENYPQHVTLFCGLTTNREKNAIIGATGKTPSDAAKV